MIAKVLELLKNNRERGNEEEWKMFYRVLSTAPFLQ